MALIFRGFLIKNKKKVGNNLVNNNIEEIIQKRNYENKIRLIVIILITFIILYSKYIKNIELLNFWFPYIVCLLFLYQLYGIIDIIFMNKLKNNFLLKEELNNILVYCKHCYILTEKYIILYFGKLKIIRYEDIILLYKKKGGANGSGEGYRKYLSIITRNGKKFSTLIGTTGVWDGDGQPIDFSDTILKKNKDVLIGKTKENKKIILEKYNIKIK